MILGSHNSLSYLPLKHWWQFYTIPWARCQTLTLEEQYNKGVRVFDIRLRFDKNGNVLFCHNTTIFKYTMDEFIHTLEKFKDVVYIRFVLDMRDNTTESVREFRRSKFINVIKNFEEKVPSRIKVNNAHMFNPWEDNYYNSRYIRVFGRYASYSDTFFKYLPTKWFAKIFNRNIKELVKFNKSNKQGYIIDYIEYAID